MISREYVDSVCKIGQGELTCRYITMGSNGFECGKLAPALKAAIDRAADRMGSKGDNCEGMQ